MNPLPSPNHPTRCLAPALFLAVAAFVLPCASAQAGCGSHDSRPSIPLDWVDSSPADRTAPPDRAPACSGPTCSRGTPAMPVASRIPVTPRVELLVPNAYIPIVDDAAGQWYGRSPTLSPIGRIVDFERPPRPIA